MKMFLFLAFTALTVISCGNNPDSSTGTDTTTVTPDNTNQNMGTDTMIPPDSSNLKDSVAPKM